MNDKLIDKNHQNYTEIDITKISQLTISYNASGQYFISFLVDEDISSLKNKNFIKQKNNYLSHCDDKGNHQPVVTTIDVGIKNSINALMTKVIQNNNEIISQQIIAKKLKGLKRHDRRLRRLQKSLSRKKKGSNNYNKQKLKVAKQYNHLVNYRNDFYHKASTEIVLSSDKIIMEDLSIKNMMKNKRLAKTIGQQSWGLFMNMIKYKSQWYDKQLIVMDRFFPSSKLCHHCHAYNANVKQQDTWSCINCKTTHQRDENALHNMLEYENYTKVGRQYIYQGNINKNILDKLNKLNPIDENQINNKNVLTSRQKHDKNLS